MNSDVKVKLTALALKIADAALADSVGLGERLDAFKVLTAYYVGTRKLREQEDPGDDDDKEFNFGSIQQRIKDASDR